MLVYGKDANRTRELDKDLSDDVPGEFPDLAVGLSRRGFSVLMIDLRGHGQSGQARFGFGLTSGATCVVPSTGSSPEAFARPHRVLGISMARQPASEPPRRTTELAPW